MTGPGQMQVSAREAEVLAAIGDHRSNAQIAHALHISVRTVESHVSSLLRKYGVADRRELADLVGASATPEPSRVRGVPAARTTFVGRGTEHEQVVRALARARLVTLLGPGGMGKTRLAAVVAAAYPADGAFVDLVAVRDGLVARAVAAALDVTEQPPQPLDRALTERLSSGRTLLVLDNCEHLAEEVGELAGRLLAGCPALVVLATSRERLGVPGEHTLAVPPLTSDAEQLFLDRARAVEPGFSADVSDLVGRLDGMPLAIELAAARVASLGVDGLRSGLDDRLRLLAGGRGADPRHRSLRGVIDWSYDLLDESERTLFRRLSIYAGGFDLDAACATSSELSRGEVADLAGRLADKSLAVRRGTRWRMLETIRLYAAEQLSDGERVQLGPRYLRWAAATADRLESALNSGDTWRTVFGDVVSDLRAALAGTPAEPDPVACRLARSLAHLSFARRSLTEAGAYYVSAADRAEDPLTAAENLRSAAYVDHAVADGRAAVDHLLAAAAKAVAEDGLRAGLLAEAVISVNRYPAGALYDLPAERTEDLLREAEHLADPGDPRVTALLVAAKAWEYGKRRIDVNPDLAVEAVAAARRLGDPVLLAGALDTAVIAAGGTGRLREAKGYADERLTLVEPLPRHDPYAAAEITDAFWVASTTAIAIGDLATALSIAERAAEDPATGHPYVALPRQIRVCALLGRFDEAIAQADLLWDRWHRDGEPPMEWMASAFAVAGAVHGLLRDGDFALWQERGRRSAGTDGATLAASAAFAEALVAVHTGPDESAATLVERAFVPFPEKWWEPYARAAGAELAVVAGLPGAEQRLKDAAPAGTENDWAAAALTRASARLDGDRNGLSKAAEQFARIGAEYERAQTEELLRRL
jgi:predicted ATPase/DNA-binding CsgD family transcriptional regulator